jgi:hypothetical protein
MTSKILAKLLIILSTFFMFHGNLFAANTETAEKFIREVYSHYALNRKGIDFNDPQQTSLFFSPTLRNLIKQDLSLIHEGDASGALGADPICACQDYDDLKVIKVSIKKIGTDRAEAKVVLLNLGRFTYTLKIRLLWTSRGWRIDDISYEGMPSLRKMLEAEILELKKYYPVAKH